MKSEFAKMKTCLILILWISVTLALNAPIDPMDKDMDINQMDKKVMDNSGDLDRRRIGPFTIPTGYKKAQRNHRIGPFQKTEDYKKAQAFANKYGNQQRNQKRINDHFAALAEKYGSANDARKTHG